MRPLLLLPALVLALAGCGGSDDGRAPTGANPPAAATPAPGGGLSIEEAVELGSNEPVMVRGYVVARGDVVELCSALAESFPPSCGGPSLRVEGVDLAQVDGLKREGDVAWTERDVSFLGTVQDGVLTVSKTSI